MHLNIRRRLFLSHFFAVLLVSGSTGGYFYFIAARSLTESVQSRLENSAALIGQTLDATELESIRDASDRTSPIYEQTLDLLRSLGRTNPDIAFVYVMRHSGGRVYFVLDSDESEQQALPGREYMERMPSLMLGFQRPSADDRVYEDEWGSFMSGYAPLRNGNGEYLVGLDMRAEELQQKLEAVRIAATLSLLFAIVLAVLFSRLLSSHFTKPVRILIERCRTIARGELAPSVEMLACVMMGATSGRRRCANRSPRRLGRLARAASALRCSATRRPHSSVKRARLSPEMARPTASLNPAAARSNDLACKPRRVATRAAPPLQWSARKASF